jgi:hypothetical protein
MYISEYNYPLSRIQSLTTTYFRVDYRDCQCLGLLLAQPSISQTNRLQANTVSFPNLTLAKLSILTEAKQYQKLILSDTVFQQISEIN